MKNQNTQPYCIEPARSINLSLSENPLGCSPVVLNELRRTTLTSALEINIYPPSYGGKLKIALAKTFNCQPANIFVANGSEAVILNIPRALANPSDEVIIPQLTFPLFRLYSEFAGLNVKLIPMGKDLAINLEKMLKAVNSQTKLIFICNPNNPTGLLLKRQAILDFLEQIPESVIVIIDEANIDFGGESCLDQALARNNVLVLRTFSKGFGLAGFRVGFAVGSQQLIQQLTAGTPPFPISSLSEQLAITALSDLDFVKKSKRVVDAERKKLKEELAKLNCTVFNSLANNIFVKLPESFEPKRFFEQLAVNDISIVRGSKFDGFDDSYFRISPRDSKTNGKFLQIVKKILKGKNERT